MRYGLGEVMEMALKYLEADTKPFHMSFNINAVDPIYAPGTGDRAREGLTYNQAMYICKRNSMNIFIINKV